MHFNEEHVMIHEINLIKRMQFSKIYRGRFMKNLKTMIILDETPKKGWSYEICAKLKIKIEKKFMYA